MKTKKCIKPPKGWHCSRIAGHTGPCAATPDERPQKEKRIILKSMYLHGDKETNYEIAEEVGMTKEGMSHFHYALYEVEIEMAIDRETGGYTIVQIKDGDDVYVAQKK